jgi:hypothetical protein
MSTTTQKGLLLAIGLIALGACSQDSEPTASIDCSVRQEASYDRKNFDKCVAACIACDKGVRTTCSTSCSLKGAR